jgi:DNA-binding NtrC family response regulator
MAEKTPTLRVLVVDDERLIRWSIAETLEHAGHAVIEAEDGAAAVRALTGDSQAIDAIVLDYRLPDSNDFGLLTTLRRLSPRSAVVLMTAYGSPEIADGAFARGVHQVLSKPFDMRELQSAVLTACGVPPSK